VDPWFSVIDCVQVHFDQFQVTLIRNQNSYKRSPADINLVGQLLELTVTAYTKMPQITSTGGRLQSTCVSSTQAIFLNKAICLAVCEVT
jgi:hypothetical protein